MPVNPTIIAAFFTPAPPRSLQDPERVKDTCQEGTLMLLNADGVVEYLECTKWIASETSRDYSCLPFQRIFYSEDHKQGLVVNARHLSQTGFSIPANIVSMAEIVQQSELDQRVSKLRSSILTQAAKQNLLTKQREEQIAVYKHRVFHVIMGALITPLEIVTGAIRIAFVTSRVALALLALGVVKVTTSMRRANVKQIESAEKRVGEIASFASRQVRIALLQFVPIIGAQLANQYKQAQSLKGFIDAPAIGGLIGTVLSKLGLRIPQMVYGWRSDESDWGALLSRHKYNDWNDPPDREKEKLMEKYWSLPSPTVSDAKAELEAHRYNLTLVRIPVKTHDGKIRYHDATMEFAPGNQGNVKAKTVIMYHPNAANRLCDYESYGKQYLEQGYNVLYPSFAGDDVIEGTGDTYRRICPPCTEEALREDAEADIAFLQELEVSHVGIYGLSLGGAQVMNFAQAATSSKLQIDFLTLNKTFTNAFEVCGRVVRNFTKSRFLERLVTTFAKRFFIEEHTGTHTHCDCLDNVAKLKEIKDAAPFHNTQYTIIGGYRDDLMGEPDHPSINYAHDIFSAVQDLGQRARIIMENKGHWT